MNKELVEDKAAREAAYMALPPEERRARYDKEMNSYQEFGIAPPPECRWTTFREYDISQGEIILVGLSIEEAKQYRKTYAETIQKEQERIKDRRAKAEVIEYDDEAKKLLAQGFKEWRSGSLCRIYLKGVGAGYYDVNEHKYKK